MNWISVLLARRLCRAVFVQRMGTPDHIADVAADVLVEANLRGIDSHGIQVLPYYLEKWLKDQIVADSEPIIVTETTATVVFDARQGVGHYASLIAMDEAIARAGQSGLGAAVVRRGTHNGAISHYTAHAARQGMIGIAATACAPHVAPHGGTRGLHGTNPLSYALPRGDGEPVVFDFSTGHSSAKLHDHVNRHGTLPADRVLDAAGRPTTDPDDLKDGWILPVAGHIGYGLGLLVDGLTAALADSPIGQELPLVSDTSGPYHGAFFALAVSPDAFAGAEAFANRIGKLIRQVDSIPPQDPAHPLRWPGQRGWQERERRSRKGIPMPPEQWETLIDELAAGGVAVDPLVGDD